MTTGKQIYALAKKHIGEEYVVGTPVPKDDAKWKGPWDCSELVSWCVYQTSKILYGCKNNKDKPAVANAHTGSWGRDADKIGIIISIERAAAIKGAAVLRVPTTERGGHIVISDGKGGTVEAKNSDVGVVESTLSERRWDMGVLVPGINYLPNLKFRFVVRKLPPIYRLIKPLMTGPKIKDIQKALREKGFNPGKIDGIFNKNTCNAVIDFQEAKGIVPDGEVGPETLKALGIKE